MPEGKRPFPLLALIVGACLASAAWADDWRALRQIDLPAPLVRATWGDGAYLAEGHPMQFGRTAVTMPPPEAGRPIIVRAATNGIDGLLIENLTCTNAVAGERKCTLLLDRPNFCHLFVYLKNRPTDTDNFDVDCPTDLKLGG